MDQPTKFDFDCVTFTRFRREVKSLQTAIADLSATCWGIGDSKAEDGSLYRCPCCGCRTLTERAGYEICPVCFWEDDGQDSHDAGEVRGGPNGSLSLTQARQNFREFGASDRKSLQHVRKPTPEEI